MQRFTSPRKLSTLAALLVASVLAPACVDRSPTGEDSSFDVAIASTSWNVGDVFAAVGNGRYNVYNNAGIFKEFISQGLPGFSAGCGFNPTLTRLYTTNFSNNRVVVFDDASPHAIVQNIPTGDQSLESIVFDAAGNFYVGHADGARDVKKFDAAGNPVATFDPQVGPRGTDWVELAADQATLFYTSEGGLIRRFNVATNTQLANFADVGGNSYALRLLPPGDGSGGLLVAHSTNVLRVNGSGAVVQTYDAPGEDLWFALNLDPDGTSFWSGGIISGQFYKFDIATGAVLVTVNTGAPGSLGGLCIKGELTASVPPPPPTGTCFGLPATITGAGNIVGTPGNDVIIGSAGPDVIQGLGGDDRICGLGGDDRLFGGDGNDRVHGGDGNDLVEGQTGNDLLEGGNGNDNVQGNAGDDDVQGNGGDDLVFGNAGTDSNDGGTGTDTCYDPQGATFLRCETTVNINFP